MLDTGIKWHKNQTGLCEFLKKVKTFLTQLVIKVIFI